MNGSLYMHTLGGEPAYYEPGRQVALAGKGGVRYLCVSLEQLREEAEASRKWRKLQGMEDDAKMYGYVRICRSAFPTAGDR